MKINRNELLKTLTRLKPGLSNKEVIEQSSSFVFTDGWAYTYNDEITVSHPVDLDLECAVHSKELLQILTKMKDKEVEIYLEKSELVIASTIEGSDAKFWITVASDISLPFIAPEEDTEYAEIPENFIDALRVCALSAANENVSGILNGVHVCENYVEACDNFRLTRYDLGDDGYVDEMLIPAPSAKALQAFDFHVYTVHDGWVFFSNEDTGMELACRLVEEEYPDLSKILDVDGTDIVLPKELKKVLEKSGIFSTKDDGSALVSVEIGKGLCTVKSNNDRGRFQEKIKIKTKDDVHFETMPDILKDILSYTDSVVVSETALLFTADNFVHVVCLTLD